MAKQLCSIRLTWVRDGLKIRRWLLPLLPSYTARWAGCWGLSPQSFLTPSRHTSFRSGEGSSQQPESELQRTVFKRDKCIIIYTSPTIVSATAYDVYRTRMLYYLTGWLFWHLDSKHSLYLEKVFTFLKIFFNVSIRFNKQHIFYCKNAIFNIT